MTKISESANAARWRSWSSAPSAWLHQESKKLTSLIVWPIAAASAVAWLK